MRHFLFPGRSREASPAQIAVTGASGGAGWDPVDKDGSWRKVGVSNREQPSFTTEKIRQSSIAAYRANPMGRAIIDTYVSFVVGDSGLSLQCSDPATMEVLDGWWNDPRNALAANQALLCRDWMLMGEVVWEYLVGEYSGFTRFSPIDPARVKQVKLDRGNPLWPSELVVSMPDFADDRLLQVAQVDDATGLRAGQVGFWASWKALVTDTRGVPFLAPVLDDLDAYMQVLSNLVDRTALARYLVWDVKVEGGQPEVDAFIANRGGLHLPRSGTVEVHNQGVEWKPQTVQVGASEDTQTALSMLTNVAGGAGLAKTWLAESEGANRATSLSMAEPVRRRVNGVQREWLAIVTEFARFAVDQAVARGRLPQTVTTRNAAGADVEVRPSQLVKITGPEIAGADAKVTSDTMLNLSTALETMVTAGFMSKEAARVAAQKAWEQFVGLPWREDLSVSDDEAAAAQAAADEKAQQEGRLFAVPA